MKCEPVVGAWPPLPSFLRSESTDLQSSMREVMVCCILGGGGIAFSVVLILDSLVQHHDVGFRKSTNATGR